MKKIDELLDIYYRIYMEALLTEPAERVAYLDGFIDGLNEAKKAIEEAGDNDD